MADGTVREYRYPPHRPRTPDRYGPDSVVALVKAYQRSPEWQRLAEASRATYSIYHRDIEALGAARAVDVTRRDVLEMRDAIALTRGAGAAQGFIRAASALFNWAVDREWIDHSPTHRIKALKGGHLPTWSQAEVNAALQALPEPLRRVVVLGMHTGQRRLDLVRLRWDDYDGQVIRLRQHKTKVPLVIPAHPELRAELDRWKQDRTAVTILEWEGQPWHPTRLSDRMGRALAKIEGMPAHRNIHGLRKFMATRHASAGATVHEIAALTGHRTLSMVALYTRDADQEKLATAAILRLSDKKKRR